MRTRALAVGLGLALLGSQALAATPARAATPFPNVNITKLAGNQSEAAIAIDPLDPTHVVEFSNRERGAGMYVANSVDGGATWTVSSFARDDQFGKACCDPTLSWDAYGNLFMAWLDIEDSGAIPVAISTDGGLTFRPLKVLRPGPPKRSAAIAATEARRGDGGGSEKPGGGEKEREPSPKGSSIDQPTIVAGQGTVWVTWNNDGIMQAAGAAVSGVGQVGKFAKREDIPKTKGCSFGDIAIGPTGQVFEVCTKDKEGTDPTVATIRAATDPDGLGPLGFTAARAIGTTNVQQFDPILPQRSRTVDAESGLAWDTNQSSPHFGRLYLMWTDEQPNKSSDTDVWLRSSDDAGVTWSTPVRVNDVTTNAQFLPRIALDPTTGNLAFGWHDARNDLGDHGTGDTDGKVNTDAMYYVTFSTDGGATFA
ncbi:MAG: sialidase family protein, partial [Actinomycetota bacterium]